MKSILGYRLKTTLTVARTIYDLKTYTGLRVWKSVRLVLFKKGFKPIERSDSSISESQQYEQASENAATYAHQHRRV